MESINMDLKVMPTSFCGYNYLLVMRCNHSLFIITDMLNTRKASEVANRYFKNSFMPMDLLRSWHCLQKWNSINFIQNLGHHNQVL